MSTAFGMSAKAWLGLQTHYDLDVAEDLGSKTKTYGGIERVAA